LGNIWRFPTETGNNGGAAFLLIYIGFMLFLGVPIMVSEFVIGRHSQTSVTQSFFKMSGGKKGWKLMGLIPVVAGFLVLSYYAVVAGWTLYYAFLAGIDGFAGKTPDEIGTAFQSFCADPLNPLIWMAIILVINGMIVALGVKKGIERGAKIMMPLLFIFIIILVACSFTLPGAEAGLQFLFHPDFSKVTGQTLLNAMGQAFFSLSVGLCCLCTYATYFKKDVNLMQDGLQVATIDTLVAVCAGLIIFPAVFSITGLAPSQGPSLVFVTLPNVFQQAFGSSLVAYIFSLCFYLLLVMAALTSSISMLEMIVAYSYQERHISRPVASIGATIVCLILGAFCSLSFGIWQDVTIFGMGFFDLFDFIVAKLIMPIGGMLICVFLGWVVDEKVLRAEITNKGTLRAPYYPVFCFIIRYLAPICILLIFISQL
ncbi:MAG: sodium-dependent transporter, partial [Bacteroidaceae bacterium]|nr:sodium-dependent transporter [Bacteroidaceae bacterium]